MAIAFSEDNFESDVLSAKEPVLVDFWAVWCGPCRMLSPLIDELAKEYAGKVKVGKVNVDENQDLAAKYGVMSIPNVIIFHNGKIVEQFVGVQQKATYINALKRLI